jgi:drug/metabolite transporter (DMT)-like permease
MDNSARDNNSAANTSNKKAFLIFILSGMLFAVLWASASAATKIGLQYAQPFVIAVSRFFIAGTIMLILAHVIFKKRLPAGKEWKQLAIYGLLNISIYLGLYVLAMQKVSAGLGTLAVASNPVLISLIGSFFFKHKVTVKSAISLLLCIAGVLIAAFPLLKNNFASWDGIALLFISMLAYSAAAIYFTKVQWGDLHILTINGWQTILGGVFLLPILLFTYHAGNNHFNSTFWKPVLWLAIPVSIVAVSLWLLLIKRNAVTAAYWLFLCPVAGLIIAKFMVKEPISNYTKLGVLLVFAGLLLIQQKGKRA